ncbi:hypothetical protein GOP47_0027914 [Adiantum capillus-veneris]|nr:hypothetical protein GOP47_0027914 [Adiantum capillus-veneris]
MPSNHETYMQYGLRPEEWPDDWWLTPDMEMTRVLDILPFVFTKRHLKSHLAALGAAYVSAIFGLLCDQLPASVNASFYYLDDTFSIYLDGFCHGDARPKMMETACNLSCLSHFLARYIHLFNHSMSPIYLQIIDIGPSNPSFLRLVLVLSNRCIALNRLLSLIDTYVRYARSNLDSLGLAFAADSDNEEQYIAEVTSTEEESSASSGGMEVEDDDHSSLDNHDDDGDGPLGHDRNNDNDGEDVGGGHGKNEEDMHKIDVDDNDRHNDYDKDEHGTRNGGSGHIDNEEDDGMLDIDIGDWGSEPDDDDEDEDADLE